MAASRSRAASRQWVPRGDAQSSDPSLRARRRELVFRPRAPHACSCSRSVPLGAAARRPSSLAGSGALGRARRRRARPRRAPARGDPPAAEDAARQRRRPARPGLGPRHRASAATSTPSPTCSSTRRSSSRSARSPARRCSRGVVLRPRHARPQRRLQPRAASTGASAARPSTAQPAGDGRRPTVLARIYGVVYAPQDRLVAWFVERRLRGGEQGRSGSPTTTGRR